MLPTLVRQNRLEKAGALRLPNADDFHNNPLS